MTVVHGLMSSVLLSGAVFAATTLPLGFFGAEPITLKIGERPAFSGRLEELATPYLTLTTILSLGIGVATTGALAWQSSSLKLTRLEEKTAALKQQLQEKEALVEHLKFSDQKMQSTGLDFFLEPDLDSQQSLPVSQLQRSNGDGRRATYVASTNPSQPENNLKTGQTSVSHTAANLHSHALKDTNQVETLMENLKQVMSQIEQLKA